MLFGIGSQSYILKTHGIQKSVISHSFNKRILSMRPSPKVIRRLDLIILTCHKII